MPLAAQIPEDDIIFVPSSTQAEFTTFSRLFAQGIYATPVEPARARGLLGFDIGFAANAVPVDTNASYWTKSVSEDFTVSDHVVIPRITASKGISVATIAATYAKIPDTDIAMIGGSIDVPIISGGIVSPTLAIRAAYSQLQGLERYDLKTYGVEIFLSKGFGPVTPYIAAGQMKLDAEGIVTLTDPTAVPVPNLTHDSSMNRYTVGVRISMFIPKLVIEATQAEERSYAAKISIGL